MLSWVESGRMLDDYGGFRVVGSIANPFPPSHSSAQVRDEFNTLEIHLSINIHTYR